MRQTRSTSLPVPSVHDYERAARQHRQGRFGPDAIAADGESAARLSASRVEEFRSRVVDLVAEYFGPAAAEWGSPVKYGFRWVLTPVDTAPDDDRRVARE